MVPPPRERHDFIPQLLPEDTPAQHRHTQRQTAGDVSGSPRSGTHIDYEVLEQTDGQRIASSGN